MDKLREIWRNEGKTRKIWRKRGKFGEIDGNWREMKEEREKFGKKRKKDGN